MRTTGYEVDLMKSQVQRGVGIFACEGHAVFTSGVALELGSGPAGAVSTEVIPASAQLQKGSAMTPSWLNTETFLRAWERIRSDGLLWHHDWVSKADPDAVVIVSRLRDHLAGKPGSGPMYIKNCVRNQPPGFGMYGALETLNKHAVGAYLDGLGRCQSEMDWHSWGEDYFLQMCLDKLGVQHVEDFGLLKDGNCLASPSPCNTGQVAFHPFKSAGSYLQCLSEAE
mmetsp:Transcript_76660/g.169856  ORF Transcript_76660/g.169856 Transcript_76660/m.169856 type:complete len:226 (-) Transcript_76660:33-710(-)